MANAEENYVTCQNRTNAHTGITYDIQPYDAKACAQVNTETDRDGPHSRLGLMGSISGLESCLGLDVAGLTALSRRAAESTLSAMNNDKDRYWWWRCRQLRIDQVQTIMQNTARRAAHCLTTNAVPVLR